MRIYQVYNMLDMAASDSFFPTRGEAMKAIRDYGCTGQGIPEDNKLYWNSPDDGSVCLAVHEIKCTRKAICAALLYIPNR